MSQPCIQTEESRKDCFDFNAFFGTKGEFKLFGKENVGFEDIEKSLDQPADTKCTEQRNADEDEQEEEDKFLKERLNDMESSYRSAAVGRKKLLVKSNVSYKDVLPGLALPVV